MQIPIAKVHLKNKEILSVLEPLKNGWLVQGPKVKQFEDAWSNFTQSKHSIAVTSCTSALQLSLSALNISRGDEVIVPAFTWVSTANVVEHLGGKVVFCDIDLNTFNIDLKQIEKKITKKTKAIIPVHLFGLAVDMHLLKKIAKKYNLLIIEDAACGFGSKHNNQHVGTFGETGCFSFHPRKSISTGEGGMITTNSNELAKKLRILRDHGASITDLQRHYGAKPFLLSDHILPGFNQRMTDIQASLGYEQMKRADKILKERINIANFYNNEFSKIEFLKLPSFPKNYIHSYQSYPCIFEPEKINLDNIEYIHKRRNDFMEKLQHKGISTRPATHAVHMLSYYKQKYNHKPSDFPNSLIANHCSISFPMYNSLRKSEQKYVISSIKNI